MVLLKVSGPTPIISLKFISLRIVFEGFLVVRGSSFGSTTWTFVHKMDLSCQLWAMKVHADTKIDGRNTKSFDPFWCFPMITKVIDINRMKKRKKQMKFGREPFESSVPTLASRAGKSFLLHAQRTKSMSCLPMLPFHSTSRLASAAVHHSSRLDGL